MSNLFTYIFHYGQMMKDMRKCLDYGTSPRAYGEYLSTKKKRKRRK